MERAQQARDYMTGGYNCAQSVVKAYAGETHIDETDLIHLAFPFGGGFGRQGLVCGAVSGAAMILGSVYGPKVQDPAVYRETIYRLTNELINRFQSANGAYLCRDLLHLDISKPEQAKTARETGVFTTLCPVFVQSAAEILEAMLVEANQQ
jgi:C_GCAxxG_C_C family probable redox protein